jgi:hypothetical protein
VNLADSDLHLREAAIHEQFRARDVAAVAGREKYHGFVWRCRRYSTNRFAVAGPMPPLPPVMSAVFPSSLPIELSLAVVERLFEARFGV